MAKIELRDLEQLLSTSRSQPSTKLQLRWECPNGKHLLSPPLSLKEAAATLALYKLLRTHSKTPKQANSSLRTTLSLLYALKLEGHPRHHSQHAAGVVVTQEPVEALRCH
jgi:hypothetical protein